MRKEERDFLGRWSIGKVWSDAYVHTSRQVVERIQTQVLDSLLHSKPEYDESELLEDIKDFADKHGLVGHRIRGRHPAAVHGPRADVGEVSDEEVPDEYDLEVAVQQMSQEVVQEPSQELSTKYFVTHSRRTGVRRLHVVGACPVRHEKCIECQFVDSLNHDLFDAVCKLCQKRVSASCGEGTKLVSSSESASSSSTSSEDEVDRGACI